VQLLVDFADPPTAQEPDDEVPPSPETDGNMSDIESALSRFNNGCVKVAGIKRRLSEHDVPDDLARIPYLLERAQGRWYRRLGGGKGTADASGDQGQVEQHPAGSVSARGDDGGGQDTQQAAEQEARQHQGYHYRLPELDVRGALDGRVTEGRAWRCDSRDEGGVHRHPACLRRDIWVERGIQGAMEWRKRKRKQL